MPNLHFWDTLNFLSKLRPRRVWNLCMVIASYYWSRYTQRPRQWGRPFTINFEPTTACNLRCPECPSGLRQFTRPTGTLKTDFFRRTIDELAPDLLYLIFYFQGEPYINPAFLDMVTYAQRRGLYTISSTNGHFLNDENARRTVESGLDRLIISIDGTTQDTYEQYRKEGSLDDVLEGTRNLVRWKQQLRSRTPHIIIQFLVVRPNEHQIPAMRQLARELGVDELVFKTAQVYDYAQGNPLIPENPRYSRYRQRADGTYVPKAALHNHCWKLWHACVITWDGLVVPCCFDKDAQHQLGDLKKASFGEIWQGAAYEHFRQQLFRGRSQIDICTNCTEGCKVWLEPE
jgi:radical SAM protein with 4Fe4S-binding SPASM domain